MKLPKQITVVPQTAPPVVRTPHPQTLSAPFIPPVSINQSINPSQVKNNPLGKPNQVSSANLSTTPPTIPVPTPSQTPTVSPQQIQRIIPTSPKPIDEVVPPASQAVPPAAIEPSSPKEPTPLSKEPKAITTFFCYAHSDEQLLNKLKTHLKPQQREGLLQIWYDRDISAGAEWKQEIEEQLNTAQIILLLVSPDFMASDYCYSIEMQRALERHDSGEARAIPIILRPVDWKITPLGKLQALPKDGKPITTWQLRDNAYLEVAQGIRAVVESFLTPPQQAKNQVPIQSNQQKQGQRLN